MAAFGDSTKSWDNVAVLVDESIIPQALCSPILQTPTRQNIKQKATLIRNKNAANRQSAPEQRIRKGDGYSLAHVAKINPVKRTCASMPLSVKAATPKNIRHRKPKKQFIEPEKPYPKGLPPKSSHHSFVPVSSYPATVSYDPNTASEQLKATEDLVSLYLTPEDDFTQSPPWSRNGCLHKPKKGSKKRSIEPVKTYTDGFPPKRRHTSFVPDSPYPDTVSADPNTAAETIHAIEAGEGSEDTGLTATAPTSRQTNREATGEGSEDTGQ